MDSRASKALAPALAVWVVIGAALGAAPTAGADSAASAEFREALARKPDPAHGSSLFRSCAICHGNDGAGVTDGSVPAIAGQYARVILRQLVDFRHHRRWDVRMEHFVDQHRLAGPQDLADVAAFVASLPRHFESGRGPGDAVGLGESVYENRCASCHGAQAQGDEHRGVPRLAAQHYQYLMRQIYDTADARRPNMESDHVGLLGALERRDILAVSDYLARLPPDLTAPRATSGSANPGAEPDSERH